VAVELRNIKIEFAVFPILDLYGSVKKPLGLHFKRRFPGEKNRLAPHWFVLVRVDSDGAELLKGIVEVLGRYSSLQLEDPVPQLNDFSIAFIFSLLKLFEHALEHISLSLQSAYPFLLGLQLHLQFLLPLDSQL